MSMRKPRGSYIRIDQELKKAKFVEITDIIKYPEVGILYFLKDHAANLRTMGTGLWDNIEYSRGHWSKFPKQVTFMNRTFTRRSATCKGVFRCSAAPACVAVK
jgi:hypothetical protein